MEKFAALVRADNLEPLRFLVVDDSMFARRNLSRMVESFGGSVAGEAGDGSTAVVEYSRSRPDMVLMDIVMPCMEGIEALERILQQDSDARVVMVSSVGYQDNIVTALRKGAKHFIQKPVKPELLYEVVKFVMGSAAVGAAPAGAIS